MIGTVGKEVQYFGKVFFHICNFHRSSWGRPIMLVVDANKCQSSFSSLKTKCFKV